MIQPEKKRPRDTSEHAQLTEVTVLKIVYYFEPFIGLLPIGWKKG